MVQGSVRVSQAGSFGVDGIARKNRSTFIVHLLLYLTSVVKVVFKCITALCCHTIYI